MGRKRHTREQIIRKLREAEVQLAKGQPMVEVARELEPASGPQSCFAFSNSALVATDRSLTSSAS